MFKTEQTFSISCKHETKKLENNLYKFSCSCDVSWLLCTLKEEWLINYSSVANTSVCQYVTSERIWTFLAEQRNLELWFVSERLWLVILFFFFLKQIVRKENKLTHIEIQFRQDLEWTKHFYENLSIFLSSKSPFDNIGTILLVNIATFLTPLSIRYFSAKY
jgi:hypothetical protein